MNKLMELAPTILGFLGGPAGGIAGAGLQWLAGKLGAKGETVDAIKEALQGYKPEDAIALRKIDVEFQEFCMQNGLDYARIDLEDKKSAREMQIATQSVIPGILAITITIGFFSILGYMLTDEYKASEPLLVMLGSLGTAWTMIVGFYFGSSQSSDQKNAMLDRMINKDSAK